MSLQLLSNVLKFKYPRDQSFVPNSRSRDSWTIMQLERYLIKERNVHRFVI